MRRRCRDSSVAIIASRASRALGDSARGHGTGRILRRRFAHQRPRARGRRRRVVPRHPRLAAPVLRRARRPPWRTPDDALMAMDQVKPDVLVVTVGRPAGRARLAAAARARAEAGRRRQRADRRRRCATAADDGAPEGVNVHLTEPLEPVGALPGDLHAAGDGLMGRRDPLPRETLVGVQVLVIDDDPEACELLATILGYCGALVDDARRRPRPGCGASRGSMPDVVVCDIVMATHDGYWFLASLRRVPGGAALPVDRAHRLRRPAHAPSERCPPASAVTSASPSTRGSSRAWWARSTRGRS